MWIFVQKSENLGEIGKKWASPEENSRNFFFNMDLNLGWILGPSSLPCLLELPWAVVQRQMPPELCLAPHLSSGDASSSNTRGLTCSFHSRFYLSFYIRVVEHPPAEMHRQEIQGQNTNLCLTHLAAAHLCGCSLWYSWQSVGVLPSLCGKEVFLFVCLGTFWLVLLLLLVQAN